MLALVKWLSIFCTYFFFFSINISFTWGSLYLPLGKNYNLCNVFFSYIITIYAVVGGLGKSIHRSVHFKTLARQNGFRVWSINWKDGKGNWKSRKVLDWRGSSPVSLRSENGLRSLCPHSTLINKILFTHLSFNSHLFWASVYTFSFRNRKLIWNLKFYELFMISSLDFSFPYQLFW